MKDHLQNFSKTVTFAYLMIALSALLYIFGLQSLMTAARTLPAGLGAFAMLPIVIEPTLSKYFSFFYLALNIPLMLLFIKKIKPKFLLRTSFFLVITTLIGILQLIPEVDNFFVNTLEQLIVKKEAGKTLEETTYDKVWPMLALPAIAGVLVGAGVALSWKYGGSTAGADIVTYYYSTKKKKQVGTVTMFVSLAILASTFSVFLATNDKGLKSVWFASIAGSIIYIMMSGIIVNNIYPKYKKVAVEIHSTKMDDITKWMDANYKHAYRVESSISNYAKCTKQHIVTVMLLLETKDFVKSIKTIDEEAWISVARIEKTFGKFDTTPVE